MTTLACNKTMMAGDLQLTISEVMKVKGNSKVFFIPANNLHYDEDFLIGFAGRSAESLEVADFYRNPEIYKTLPRVKDVSGLVLTKSGKIFVFDHPSHWIQVNEEFATIGSGGLVALGAMHLGASPAEAIEAASKVDPYTGMGVTVVEF